MIVKKIKLRWEDMHLVSKATIQLIAKKKDLLSLILGACLNLSRTVFLFPDETIFSFQNGFKLSRVLHQI